MDTEQYLFEHIEGFGAGREGWGVSSLCRPWSWPCLNSTDFFFFFLTSWPFPGGTSPVWDTGAGAQVSAELNARASAGGIWLCHSCGGWGCCPILPVTAPPVGPVVAGASSGQASVTHTQSRMILLLLTFCMLFTCWANLLLLRAWRYISLQPQGRKKIKSSKSVRWPFSVHSFWNLTVHLLSPRKSWGGDPVWEGWRRGADAGRCRTPCSGCASPLVARRFYLWSRGTFPGLLTSLGPPAWGAWNDLERCSPAGGANASRTAHPACAAPPGLGAKQTRGSGLK